MKTFIGSKLTRLLLLLLTLIVVAVLAACSAPPRVPDPAPRPETVALAQAPAPLPAHVPTRTLAAYKAAVARHVMLHNPERIFEGVLPPLLPAIVVLNITVDRDGRLADVQVQRSRDQGAAEVALASLRRSGQLPRPDGLGPPQRGLTTFSETFLFAERYRFQIRTLAGPQSAGL